MCISGCESISGRANTEILVSDGEFEELWIHLRRPCLSVTFICLVVRVNGHSGLSLPISSSEFLTDQRQVSSPSLSGDQSSPCPHSSPSGNADITDLTMSLSSYSPFQSRAGFYIYHSSIWIRRAFLESGPWKGTKFNLTIYRCFVCWNLINPTKYICY